MNDQNQNQITTLLVIQHLQNLSIMILVHINPIQSGAGGWVEAFGARANFQDLKLPNR